MDLTGNRFQVIVPLRREEEQAQVQELQQQLNQSRKQFEQLRLKNEKALEEMRDSL